MTTRYKLIMAYDGHLFHGFQIQPNGRTVQGVIEEALKKMTKGGGVVVHGSGRTDAGVHAKGQVIHFDYPGKEIPAKNMMLALSALMPIDTIFFDGEIVDSDFHVQYSTKRRWYRYIIDQYRFTDPFNRFYTGRYPYPLDIALVREAAKDSIREHGFTSFAASGGQIVSKVRTIYYVNITSGPDSKKITFDFISSGFLYNVVKILVGTLLGIDNKKHPVDGMPRVLAARDRQEVRTTAPANELYLQHVFCEEVPKKYRLDPRKD